MRLCRRLYAFIEIFDLTLLLRFDIIPVNIVGTVNSYMKTVYITDLDGTLLRNDQTVSQYTRSVINGLTARNIPVTFATARSLETASIVTAGVEFGAPRIIYNGAFIIGTDGRIVASNSFGSDGKSIANELLRADVYPIVYSVRNGAEKFSFIPERLGSGAAAFIETRKDCGRCNPVISESDLCVGDIFYFLCIDDIEKISSLHDRFKNDYSCVYSVNMYHKNMWLEIMPKGVTKASAIAYLKEMLGCRIVAFGDGKNDIEMFKAADECFATENAVPELKAIATGVIGRNEDDAVAKWLERNAK